MFSRLVCEGRLDDLHEQLRRAQVVTPDLLSKLAAYARARIATPNRAARLRQIDRLIAAEAWTEAALALIELGWPHWKLRRLVYEDDGGGPIRCVADTRDVANGGKTGSVPRCRAEPHPVLEIMCCDNFA